MDSNILMGITTLCIFIVFYLSSMKRYNIVIDIEDGGVATPELIDAIVDITRVSDIQNEILKIIHNDELHDRNSVVYLLNELSDYTDTSEFIERYNLQRYIFYNAV